MSKIKDLRSMIWETLVAMNMCFIGSENYKEWEYINKKLNKELDRELERCG